jgi:hypothetical protein
MTGECPVHDSVVDFNVFVNEHVAEPGHIPEIRQRFGGYYPVINQDNEGILVIVRVSEPLQRDDASTDIETSLDTQMQTALYRAFPALISLILGQRLDACAFILQEPYLVSQKQEPFLDRFVASH